MGIAGVGDGRSLGRIGLKTLVYFEIVTTIAIVLGLVLGNVLHAGVGTDLSQLGHTDIARYQQTIIAFSTCSSATVLPQLMKKMEDFGVPKSITTFVVPTGYTFNLDGASIYLGIGTLFVAQLYGVHLGLQEQIVLVRTMVVTSKGAAGVPGFMFVILLTTLASAGLPLEGLAFIAGVDRIMDMGRTALNVVGNALAPLIIARWEGQYDAEKGKAYIASLDA